MTNPPPDQPDEQTWVSIEVPIPDAFVGRVVVGVLRSCPADPD